MGSSMSIVASLLTLLRIHQRSAQATIAVTDGKGLIMLRLIYD
jgi:hypothetical protein